MFKRALFLLATHSDLPFVPRLRRQEGRRRADGRRGVEAGRLGGSGPRRRPPRRSGRGPRRRRRHGHRQSQLRGHGPGDGPIKMDADAFCKSEHKEPVYEQEVVVNPNKTLEWVLVYVKEGVSGSYPAPTEAVTLDQHGCQYRPHVFGIQAGQPLKVLNSDGTLHNIHALPKKNAEFNIGQPFKGMETVKKFDNTEVPVRFKCDVHKWMGAYTGVFNHPFFAVTNDQGTFEIKNLPPGNYVIEAWHEKYGTQTQNVTISGSEPKTVDFNFKG